MRIVRVIESGDEGIDLDPLASPSRVDSIEFVNSTKVR
jgi:hypothetical protein